MDYETFLARKVAAPRIAGFDVSESDIHPLLFDWQRRVVQWAVALGKAALFEECGLGKTLQQLEWGRLVAEHTGGRVLILAPLAVAHQTVAEGVKINLPVRYCRSQGEADRAEERIIITNYDMLKAFDGGAFAGVVLDESSILKSFTGATKRLILEAFRRTPYKLACTATPAPNDHLELGNHGDFLDVMPSNEMISRWFINDSMAAGNYRLKKHAAADFWRWVCSWAVCISKPSDIGYENDGFILPPLQIHNHVVSVDHSRAWAGGKLFIDANLSATSMWQDKKATAKDRCQRAADLVNESPGPWIVWCDTNHEADILKGLLPEAVEIRGNDSRDRKEAAALWFTGQICFCELTTNGLRAKLAACGSQNTKNTGEKKCEMTPHMLQKSKTEDRARLNKTKNICVPITEPIESDCLRTCEFVENLCETIATQPDGHDTPLTPLTETKSSGKSENGQGPIRQRHSPKISASLDLPQNPTMRYSQAREGAVQSAATEMKIADGNGCTLITTMIPAELGDSSAHGAISDLASSRTVQSCLNRQQCTCGGITDRRILISKPSVFGWGLNFQHCHQQVFAGVDYSFEKTYQAMRRSWRFGQTETVHVHLISAESEGDIMQTLNAKQASHREMQQAMNGAMAESGLVAADRRELTVSVEEATENGKDWMMHLGDCVQVLAKMDDESIDFTIFSPPFSNLYIYSDSIADMGNCAGDEEFFQHFGFLLPELLRVTLPGRLMAIHCKDLPLYRNRDGAAGLSDFPGHIIAAAERAGWTYHSRVTIWKDPVIEMQRTKNHGLLYKNLRLRGEVSRQGMADYVITFRKWQGLENTTTSPKPVLHDREDFELERWQRYASPVWFDINQTRVLNCQLAREGNDEKHICPLQLDVIERCLDLWTNPGDLVLSPFAGIGSEGYVAVKAGRRFVGVELKRSYFDVACDNLREAEHEANQTDLFALAGIEVAS